MNKRFSILVLIVWILFLSFTIIDNNLNSINTLTPIDTLSKSIFARGMFTDIGILSCLISLWIVFRTKNKYKIPFAIATLFLGSLAALLYISLYFWTLKTNENE